LIIELDDPGMYFAVRPSGTEPKIKFYFFAFCPPGSEELPRLKDRLNARIMNVAADLFDYVRVDPLA
jgi:phosphomannomutase